ncbi:MAG: MotA/TolQ/ExbB proton channel family protein [Saprospiraceae bacterium]|nr:MotA/TolQ/ExbB proton channel family protein [Saprospiraceae bacterium]
MTAVKTTPTPAKQDQPKSGMLFTVVAMVACFVASTLVYKFVFGASSHFIDGDNTKDPLPGDYFGTIYKGGFVVPMLLGLLFVVIVFVIERFITLTKASGGGNVDGFVRNIRTMLDRGDVSAAIAACDRQKGSVANVVRAGLTKYGEMQNAPGMDKDQKVLAIQKEIEEATTLELPMLESNLSILATIASVATLLGLFGTVLGMIRSFAALANAGAPDSTALATGISEALINTALGIGTSAIAIIAYNFFTGRIDALTYRIDEAGYSLTQTFAAKHN